MGRFSPLSLYKWECGLCGSKKHGRRQSWNPKYKANRGAYRHKRQFHKDERMPLIYHKKGLSGEKSQEMIFI